MCKPESGVGKIIKATKKRFSIEFRFKFKFHTKKRITESSVKK